MSKYCSRITMNLTILCKIELGLTYVYQLVMKILLLFQTYEGAEQMDVFGILAEDDKFMNVADDLHKDFEKSFNIAMRMGRRI